MSAFFDLWSWWPQTGLTITRADLAAYAAASGDQR